LVGDVNFTLVNLFGSSNNSNMIKPNRYFVFTVSALAALLLTAPINAQTKVSGGAGGSTLYKCTKNGKVEYSNSPCDAKAQPAVLKGTVTSLNKEAFVGKARAEADPAGKGKTILGVTPPNPIEECRKKGGKLDLELRACALP
jgi:hypothetical protein